MAVNWVVDKIASGIAFAPPKPSYFLVPSSDGNHTEYKIAGHRSLDSNICTQHKAYLIPAEDKSTKKIAAVFIEYKRQTSYSSYRNCEPKTVLFSHGNGEDLGQLIEYIWYLSDRLKANILAYDYSGYGVTTGRPSVQQSLKDIQIVFKYMKEQMKILPEDIILYGQSVGSGPSVYLAATENNVGGLVLHSPLQSGLRVLYPNLQKWPMWCDVYPNYMLVHNIKCPTLIMHGTKDQIIDVSHAKSLEQIMRDSCSYLRTFWAVGYDHSDIQVHPDYFRELKHFLNKCHTIKIYNFEKEILKQELSSSRSIPSSTRNANPESVPNSHHQCYQRQGQPGGNANLNFQTPFADVRKRYEVDVQKVRVTQNGKLKRHRFKVINIIYKQDQKIKLIQQNSKQNNGQVSRSRSASIKKLKSCAGGIRIVRAKRKKVVVKAKPMKYGYKGSQAVSTNIDIMDAVEQVEKMDQSNTQKQQRLKSLIKKLSMKRKQTEEECLSSDEESPQSKLDHEEKVLRGSRNGRKSSLANGSKSQQPFQSAKTAGIRLILKGMQQKSQ